MKCSICETEGHNARTCTKNPVPPAKTDETHALWVKFDNITPKQADELLKAVIDVKSAIAPTARGTFAKGSRTEMPQKIAEALKVDRPGEGDEPKKIE